MKKLAILPAVIFAGLLFVSVQGCSQETKSDMNRAADDLRDATKDSAQSLKEMGQDAASSVKETANDAKRAVQDATD